MYFGSAFTNFGVETFLKVGRVNDSEADCWCMPLNAMHFPSNAICITPHAMRIGV
jgi:hypothetical protein